MSEYECGECGNRSVVVAAALNGDGWRVGCGNGHPIVPTPGLVLGLAGESAAPPDSRDYCLQCGMPWGAPACGLTHEMIAAERRGKISVGIRHGLVYIYPAASGDPTVIIADLVTVAELATHPRRERMVMRALLEHALDTLAEADDLASSNRTEEPKP